MRILPLIFLISTAFPLTTQAGEVPFDSAWKTQGFLRLSPNEYELGGNYIGVRSQDSVSMIFRPVPEGDRQASAASWNWRVSESVIATDLTVKGVDDRNLALYFVFVDARDADRLANASARKIFNNKSTRTLVYVWGGDYPRHTLLPSPFQKGQLVTVALRPAGTGAFSETVDLATDFARAFGTAPGVLVGIGVSADSDDTDGAITGQISNLVLR